MRILTLNGSPRKERGNTQILVDCFNEGAKQAGAVCETIYTQDLNVKNCMGCFGCWKSTPGKCVIKDDMESVLKKIQESDVIVYATPLYHFGMTADLKKVIERTLPINSPYIVNKGEHYGHPSRFDDSPKKYVVISNCGFPERSNFKVMMEHFKALTGDRIVGEILCTAGEFLNTPYRQQIEWYLDAVKKSGSEVAEFGRMSEETKEILQKDYIDIDKFLMYANGSWQVQGEKAPTVAEAKTAAIR